MIYWLLFLICVTIPSLISLVNGMLIFFLGLSVFMSMLISSILGLLIGGLIGSLSNLTTFSISALNGFYFGLMGPMIATPIISPNLCGIFTLGSPNINILLLSTLGALLVCVFSLLYINFSKR